MEHSHCSYSSLYLRILGWGGVGEANHVSVSRLCSSSRMASSGVWFFGIEGFARELHPDL